MTDIGETLRAARETTGFSLDEVAAGTRIRVQFLQALEENDYEALGGHVYTRGFLRNYAAFLGLDPEPLLAQLGFDPLQLPVSEPAPRFLAEPLQSNPLPVGRILLMLSALALLALLAFSLWWQPAQRDAVLARLGLRLPGPAATVTATSSPAAMAQAPEPASGGVISQTTQIIIEPFRSPTAGPAATAVPTATLPPRTPTPDPNATATEVAVPTATPGLVGGIVLVAEVVDRTWTEVYVDGQEQALVYRILEPGEQLEWSAENELFLRSGNAGGLRLSLNGQDLGLLGRLGGLSVRRWQLNPDGGTLELVESLDR